RRAVVTPPVDRLVARMEAHGDIVPIDRNAAVRPVEAASRELARAIPDRSAVRAIVARAAIRRRAAVARHPVRVAAGVRTRRGPILRPLLSPLTRPLLSVLRLLT